MQIGTKFHLTPTKQFSLLELFLQEGADLGCLFTLIVLLLDLLGPLLVQDLLLFRSLQGNEGKHE